MKKILFLFLSISFIACRNKQQEPLRIETGNKNAISRQPDTIKTLQKNVAQSDELSPLEKELQYALEDPSTDKYFIEIFIKGKMVRHPDDKKMLSVMDSLFSSDTNKDYFYFLVFTRSMNGADGIYAEAVGLHASDFVVKKTGWFADYFNLSSRLTEKDKRNWANSIISEIQVSHEGKEEQAINAFVRQIRNKIRFDRKEYQVIIERFITDLRKVEKERITNSPN